MVASVERLAAQLTGVENVIQAEDGEILAVWSTPFIDGVADVSGGAYGLQESVDVHVMALLAFVQSLCATHKYHEVKCRWRANCAWQPCAKDVV